MTYIVLKAPLNSNQPTVCMYVCGMHVHLCTSDSIGIAFSTCYKQCT